MKAKEKLLELDVRPSKRKGQNFLINQEVTDSIYNFASTNAGDLVLEIGPGLGALTAAIYTDRKKFKKIILVELEQNFCNELTQNFPEVEIHNQDVREFDFSKIYNANNQQKITVLGNLPYIFSTDIIFKLVENAAYIKSAALLLQKEFVERMAANPGTKDFAALSIGVQVAAKVRLGPIVAGSNFHPPAQVDSRLVELQFYEKCPFSLTAEERLALRKVVKASFLKRRKMLHNSLRMSGFFTLELIDAALEKTKIDGKRRAETLSIEEFVALTRALS